AGGTCGSLCGVGGGFFGARQSLTRAGAARSGGGRGVVGRGGGAAVGAAVSAAGQGAASVAGVGGMGSGASVERGVGDPGAAAAAKPELVHEVPEGAPGATGQTSGAGSGRVFEGSLMEPPSSLFDELKNTANSGLQ